MPTPTTRIALSADPERDAIVRMAGELGNQFFEALAPSIDYCGAPVFQHFDNSHYLSLERLNYPDRTDPLGHQLIDFIRALPGCRLGLSMYHWRRGGLQYTVNYGIIERPYQASPLTVFASQWTYYLDEALRDEPPQNWMLANMPLPWGTYAQAMTVRPSDELDTPLTWAEMLAAWNTI